MMLESPIELREYRTANGRIPFREWLSGLRNIQTRARTRTRLDRVQLGNFGDARPVGRGVSELRLHFGAGYRVYFGRDGDTVVILLCGGDKGSQRRDIQRAQAYWTDYLERRT